MPNTYKVTHSFQAADGTSEDQYVNQFYFFAENQIPGDVNSWGEMLATKLHLLWVAPLSTDLSVSKFYNSRCRGNLGMTRIYDATSNPATLGPPIFTMSDNAVVGGVGDYLANSNAGYTNLPEEVAVCLSYQAIHTEGDLPRRRGRIYLGPLNVQIFDDAFTGPQRVSPGAIDVILNAAQVMQASMAEMDMEWRVFSTMDGFAFKIVNFTVDNAFDTIRGRGAAPSSRVSLPIL